jgi:hypothetical protein
MADDKVTKAGKLFKEYTEAGLVGDSIFWTKARAIYTLKKDNLYKFVSGDKDQSWASFCSENGIAYSSADQKVKSWEFYILKHKFTPRELLGYDTALLYYISRLKATESKSEVIEWMDKSKLMGRGDFLQDIKGKVECMHEPEDVIEVTEKVCGKCGRKLGKITK